MTRGVGVAENLHAEFAMGGRQLRWIGFRGVECGRLAGG